MVCEHLLDQMPSYVTIQSMRYSITGIEKRKGNRWQWMSAFVTIARNLLQHLYDNQNNDQLYENLTSEHGCLPSIIVPAILSIMRRFISLKQELA